MIKKTTTATFQDGDYKGVYDWSGGIPLAVGEIITIARNSKSLIYKCIDKKIMLEDLGENQNVRIEYYLAAAE
jgi:hypothetical protein